MSLIPGWGAYKKATDRCFSLAGMFLCHIDGALSLSLSLSPPPPSLEAMKKCLQVRIINKQINGAGHDKFLGETGH